MWDGLLMLLFLCALMAGASFLAGVLPLILSLSPRQLRLMTALGTGILVGTSLAVIIPEGIETLYSTSGAGHGHSHMERGTSLAERGVIETNVFSHAFSEVVWKRDIPEGAGDVTEADQGELEHATEPDDRSGEDHSSETVPEGGGHEEHDHEHGESEKTGHDPHSWVGLSLVSGFLLMYLIDTLPRRAGGSSKPERFHISLGQFNFRPNSSPDHSSPPPPPPAPASRDADPSRPSSTTLGLIIHAAADGIALGASSTTSSSDEKSNLSLIIFIALMFHKAPAAFGLTTTLLKQNLSTRAARGHLIAFSLAAPAGALATWAAAHLFGFAGDTAFATGVLLLFSGGTFLYVAVHAMHEHGDSDSHAGHDEGARGTNGYAGVPGEEVYASSSRPGSGAGEGKKDGVLETAVSAVGMLLPLLLGIGHHH